MKQQSGQPGTFGFRRLGRCGALAALAMAAAAPAEVQAADDADVTSQAELIDGFGLVNVDGLDFGPIVPTGTGGTVRINAANGTVTTLGNVTTVETSQHRARFTVDAPIGILMLFAGDPSVTLTRQSGTETMDASLTYSAGSGLLPVTVLGLPIGFRATLGAQEIFVGGTLGVLGNQTPGVYEGTFNLQVAYL